MIIRSIHLENYRCFEDFDIDFDDRLTVLVGSNGAGKTAVLDALSVFLQKAGHPENKKSSLFEFPVSSMAIGCKPEDIVYRLELQQGSNINGNPLPLPLKFFDTYYGSIRLIATDDAVASLQMACQESTLCAAYMAGRFVLDEDSILKNSIYDPPVHAAFENNFKRTIDYASTLSWFNNADADEARTMRDSGQKNELPELKAVREALSKALLGHYERPRMYGNPPELIIYKQGTDIAYKVSQLSDGYRAMLALVMDLARRMAQAYGDEVSPGSSLLHVPAIVLIDEVELHLHPSWQQTVLNTLLDIFPNTQFIVTTHSPQVLTSIPSRHIRILNDGKAYSVGGQTQGAEASRLLRQIFGVELRPGSLPIVRALRDYSKLVYEEKWDTPEAGELREKLSEHYGNDDPELMELDLHIENSKWERGL